MLGVLNVLSFLIVRKEDLIGHKVQNNVFVELQSDVRVQSSFLSSAAVYTVNLSYSKTNLIQAPPFR